MNFEYEMQELRRFRGDNMYVCLMRKPFQVKLLNTFQQEMIGSGMECSFSKFLLHYAMILYVNEGIRFG